MNKVRLLGGTAGEVTVSFGTSRCQPGLAVSTSGAVTVAAYYSGWTMPLTTIQRFTESGVLDVGFGDSGVAVVDGVVGSPVGLDAEGAVLLVHTDPGDSSTSIARVTTSGVLDATYGTALLRGTLTFTDAVVADDGAVTAVSRHYMGGYVVRAERLDA